MRKEINMICTKCNSEIPNGAKFCPVCGNACGTVSDVKPAAAPPAREEKTFCGKCGLELRRGAKFCAVCGTPAAVGDIKPAVNSGSVFGGGDMSAVSLDKPGASDNLVAAMNTPYGVPVPSGTLSAPGYGGGDNPAAFIPESPAAPPPYAPAADPGAFGSENPFGDMGAAAVVAAPIKKKRTGAKVAIIIAAAVAVLIAAAAVFFFTNKATALSLIMGKSKYAAMVEGESIKQTTEKLDMPSIANGIRSASGIVSQLSAVSGGYVGSSSLDGLSGLGLRNGAGSAAAAPMMSVNSENGINMEEFISSYNKLMLDTYGVNSLTSKLDMDIQLSDSVSDLLNDQLGDEFSELIALINKTSFTTSVTSSSDKLGASMGVSSGSCVIDAKVICGKDGRVCIVFPFISETGIMIKLPTDTASSAHTETAVLEFDEKEIERLIGELVELYLAEYADCAIEMEKGELSAAGLTATGKLITAEFKGDDLADLFNKLAEHFAEDEYFRTKIVDFANECGADITEQDYKDAVMNAVEFDADSSDKLIISTVIDNAGNVLAKSYKAVDDDNNVKLTYVDSKEQFTLEISENNATVVSAVLDISPDGGVVTLKCSDGSEGYVTVKMTYSDVKKAEFCGKETVTGNFTVGMELPADFTEDIPKDLGKFSNVKLEFSNSVGQNTMECSVKLIAGNLGSIALNSVLTAENSDAGLALPSDIIDMGDIGGTPNDEALKKFEEYTKNALEKVKGLKDGEFGKLLDELGLLDELDGISDAIDPAVPYSDVVDLSSNISKTMQTVNGLPSSYKVNDKELSDRAAALISDLSLLFNDITAKGTEITQDEFDTFTRRYNALKGQADTLKRDFEMRASQQAAPNPPSSSAPGTPESSDPTAPSEPETPAASGAEGLNFDTMTDTELVELLDEYETRYFALCTDETIMTKVFSSVELESVYNTCESAYSKVLDDFNQFLDAYIDGNYSVALLRNLRKSTKTFTVMVEKFEKSVQTTV